MTRVTLQTIADHVGVSRMTVSNAFSRPDQLSDGLRQKILEAARELGYAGPDPAARALARGTTGAVGVLLTASLQYAFTDDVAVRFLGAITAELAPTGLALTLISADARGDVVPARDTPLDGAVVYACNPDTTATDWLFKRGLPLVTVDQRPVPHVPSVNVDDRDGGRQAARHVVELGHRRVGIVAFGDGPEGLAPTPTADVVAGRYIARERLAGYLDVLGAEKIRAVVHTQRRNDEDDARRAGVTLLTLEPARERPTAILCQSDVLALGVLHAADELGLRVPEDLSVVGFDDSPLARRVRPMLTTVRQDVEAKGKAATDALLETLGSVQARGRGRAKRIVLPTQLVVRDSTGPAPAARPDEVRSRASA
jgi:DNA-binding LacI/PurR family transcriptional regulator